MVAVSFVLVLALVSSTVVALPGANGFASLLDYSEQKTTLDPLEISTKSVYEWTPLSEETLTPNSDEDPVDIGIKYLVQQLNLQPDEFKMRTSFTDPLGVTHLYGVSLHEELPIGNLHAAAHIKNGQVFFYSTTLIVDDQVLTKRSPTISESTVKISSEDAVKSPTIPESTVEISSEDAVKAAVDCLGVPFYPDIAPVMESYETDNGNIFVWVFQLRDNLITQWLEVKVDANTGVIVSKEDVKRDFTYTVIKLPNESPYDGFSTIVNPENLKSSPSGWTKGYRLTGNNVWASAEEGTPFETATEGMFDMDFDPTLPPQTPSNVVAGVINAFYVANTFHDITYQYGFNERAGNFQEDNFKRGGIGGDPVIISVQNGKEQNNAHFQTPSDGEPGVLNLHIYTDTKPNRDSALDNTIIVHELTHGVSDRLTGGAHEDLCMAEIESHGLSEGYSDMMALVFTAKPEDSRDTIRAMGEYVKGDPRGVRKYPYTTDIKVNPLTYKDAIGEKDKHNLGTIWAAMLLEVYWNLVDAYGFSENLHDATQEKGNIIFLQLFVGTLMIQPCNPTFESAYDAMLAADDAYYGGINKHLIREGFAKRGLGSIS
ncbi:hypothetical protein BASA60_011590 [Batrachochytrium salamandrivorans]|nr:hypothetical protein BASA60_011590 [Batrachochytrium salamandrivorans]